MGYRYVKSIHINNKKSLGCMKSLLVFGSVSVCPLVSITVTLSGVEG